MTQPSQEQIADAERSLLAALYQNASLRARALAKLRQYEWREPLHQAIFDALVAVPSGSPLDDDAGLAARLTRRGFPDIPWRDLQQPCPMSEAEAEQRISALLALRSTD